ncbi:carboxylesterase/lipase family protein [Allokutzneria sp. NRRL B-24872]|uniref:carboxylesterase/lipase family protein n=1 Tax=Allokutzneria sp. NRRL B-24872 TaxID=1137961 RepID=UPI00143DB90F|nr:carboxylesterase family protein [Allokutzneria sp. NRRL B-24872]
MSTVRTTFGRVRGAALNDHTVFHAIPYAANTTGSARFRAPIRAQKWDGVRDGTQPGPTVPAPDRSFFGELDMRPLVGPGWVRGDDYLTVTVRTPSTATAGLPVMVFVHGGGFVSGSSRAPVLNGTAFARDGVVFVSLNYRLGAPGWLRLPGAPDNRGLLDVLAALEWVQENIAEFGGDPDNVTLFGESAGATIVSAAAATDRSGLFRRAISQSGNPSGAFSTAQADLITKAFKHDNPEEASDEELLAAVPVGVDLTATGEEDPLHGMLPFSLVAGTETLPDQPANLSSTVDWMLGTNTDEGNLYVVPYNGTRDPHELTEGLFAKGTRAFVKARRAHHYEFAWRSQAFDGKLGAAHAVELPFVFDTAHLPGLRGPKALLGPTEPPQELTKHMHNTWIRFAENGNPGWDRYPATQRFSGGYDPDPAPGEA